MTSFATMSRGELGRLLHRRPSPRAWGCSGAPALWRRLASFRYVGSRRSGGIALAVVSMLLMGLWGSLRDDHWRLWRIQESDDTKHQVSQQVAIDSVHKQQALQQLHQRKARQESQTPRVPHRGQRSSQSAPARPSSLVTARETVPTRPSSLATAGGTAPRVDTKQTSLPPPAPPPLVPLMYPDGSGPVCADRVRQIPPWWQRMAARMARTADALPQQMVYFLHLHKCGGTFVCKLAADDVYHEPGASRIDNCNVPTKLWTRQGRAHHPAAVPLGAKQTVMHNGQYQYSAYFGNDAAGMEKVYRGLLAKNRSFAANEGSLEDEPLTCLGPGVGPYLYVFSHSHAEVHVCADACTRTMTGPIAESPSLRVACTHCASTCRTCPSSAMCPCSRCSPYLCCVPPPLACTGTQRCCGNRERCCM